MKEKPLHQQVKLPEVGRNYRVNRHLISNPSVFLDQLTRFLITQILNHKCITCNFARSVQNTRCAPYYKSYKLNYVIEVLLLY